MTIQWWTWRLKWNRLSAHGRCTRCPSNDASAGMSTSLRCATIPTTTRKICAKSRVAFVPLSTCAIVHHFSTTRVSHTSIVIYIFVLELILIENIWKIQMKNRARQPGFIVWRKPSGIWRNASACRCANMSDTWGRRPITTYVSVSLSLLPLTKGPFYWFSVPTKSHTAWKKLVDVTQRFPRIRWKRDVAFSFDGMMGELTRCWSNLLIANGKILEFQSPSVAHCLYFWDAVSFPWLKSSIASSSIYGMATRRCTDVTGPYISRENPGLRKSSDFVASAQRANAVINGCHT